MRLRFILPAVVIAVGCSLGWLAASGRLVEAFAQNPKPQPTSAEGTQLPKPDPAFKGKIGETYKDSTPDYPQPVKAPKGAPNVLLDPARRRRLRHVLDIRRTGADPAPRQAREERSDLQPLPYHGAVQPDAGGPAHGPQSPQLRHRCDHRDGDGLPRLHGNHPAEYVRRCADDARQRLRHGHVWQGAQHAGAGNQSRRAVPQLAHRSGLRLLLRLQPGRNQPVLSHALSQHQSRWPSRSRRNRATTSWRT